MILLLILTLPLLAMAAPPFAETVAGSLKIESAHEGYLKYGDTNTTLFFHVYNSTYNRLNITKINCTFDLYNHTDDQNLFEGEILYDGLNDLAYNINWSIMTIGDYNYFLDCHTTAQVPAEAGYRRGGFIINHSGFEESESNLVLGLYIATIILVGALAFYFIILLGKVAEGTVGLYDVAANYAIYFALLYINQVAIEYIHVPNYLAWNNFFIQYLGWIAIIWPVLAYLISFFLRIFNKTPPRISDYNGGRN